MPTTRSTPRTYLFLAIHDCEGSSPALNTNSPDDTSGATSVAAVSRTPVFGGATAAACPEPGSDSLTSADIATPDAAELAEVVATAAANARASGFPEAGAATVGVGA